MARILGVPEVVGGDDAKRCAGPRRIHRLGA